MEHPTMLRMGSRGSELAMAQARGVVDELVKKEPRLQSSIIPIKTTGDKDQYSSLGDMGGKGVFVKEIEEALLCNNIDVAVHSLKDVPQTLMEGLMLAPCPLRKDPRDGCVSRSGKKLKDLPRGSIIGTSSLRRQAEISFHFQDRYHLQPVRGNIDTRIRKLKEGQYDALIVAVAGLKRLGKESLLTEIFDENFMMPAPGQGLLGLECRTQDDGLIELLGMISDKESDTAARAERAFVKRCGGSCVLPVGGLAHVERGAIIFRASLMMPDGSKRIDRCEKGPLHEPEKLGISLADRMLQEGGAEIIRYVQKKSNP